MLQIAKVLGNFHITVNTAGVRQSIQLINNTSSAIPQIPLMDYMLNQVYLINHI